MHEPVVSVLVPNFNNGRESSLDRQRDLLGDLLRSLWSTLEHDPTPVEIIVADDGSTDDSLQTARDWAERTWHQGGTAERPFLRLIERAHSGILSEVANLLMDESVGRITCRLDGDIVIHTPRWASRLVEIFDQGPPDLGVVGPKQLAPDGSIHAMGDWLLHPRGYHHVAQGAPRGAVTRSIEVDHVMGCFYCLRRDVWDRVGRYDESILRGQTIDYGLRVRLAGYRCIAVPTIEFTHHHAARSVRANRADTDTGLAETLRRFETKWGFDRICPDLDQVRRWYAGTSLLWNQRLFGPADEAALAGPTVQTLADSRWARLEGDEQLQAEVQEHLKLAGLLVCEASAGNLLHLGAGDGLLAHLLAGKGVAVTALERNPALRRIMTTMVARATYPGPAPESLDEPAFEQRLRDGEPYDAALILGLLEFHPNPARMIKLAARALRPGGLLLVCTAMRRTPLDGEFDRANRFMPHELSTMLQGLGLFELLPQIEVTGPTALIRLARRTRVFAPMPRSETPEMVRSPRTTEPAPLEPAFA